MKRHQNMWRNVVTLASVVADKFDESGREEVAAAIESMDNEQRTFRPQTIRERAMLLSEYEEFAKELVDKREILVKADGQDDHGQVGQVACDCGQEAA